MKRLHSLLCFLLFSCLSMAQSFEDVAAAHSITTTFGNGYYGGGISFVDFDMDGWDDLTFATADGDSIHFYKNNQGIFEKIPALIPHTEHSSQVLWVDFDNDGDRDFFVTTRLGINRLYENDGNLNLTDVTAQVGLPLTTADSYGAHFGDINNDGWLDLYVLNRHLDTHYNYLYLFDGNSYTDITTSSGLKYGAAMSFVAAFFDYNQDGFQDIYIAEDKYFGNKLFENNGDTTFTEISGPTNCYYEIDAMNVGVGDPNLDGWPDIYITNTPASINPESKFLINVQGADFDEVALELNANLPNRTGWGANWLDCDNDGDEDLYVCASYVLPPFSNPSNALYINQDTTFVETNIPNDNMRSYCNAIADFNHDGHLDIAVSQTDSAFSLFQNQITDSLHWLSVQLQGTTANIEGIGSEIKVWAQSLKQTRWVLCGEAYLAQNSFTQHFGLDTLSMIDSLKITWLGGQEDFYYNLNADTIYSFIQNSTVLPIELISFDAQREGDMALLNWQIANQRQGDQILLQRSSNGQSFSTIAQFSSENIGTKAFTYSDSPAILALHYYYRLEMKSIDGSNRYSQIKSVAFDRAENVTIYPTIRHHDAIKIESSQSNIQSIQIISSEGKVVFKKTYSLPKNYLLLEQLKLQKGIYHVLIELSSKKVIVKKIIQY